MGDRRLEPPSLIKTEAGQGESAAGRFLDEVQKSAAGVFREADVLGVGTIKGFFQHGLAHAVDHPRQFAGEMAGAAGVAFALRGPLWLRLPAAAFTAVGTISYAGHIRDSLSATLPIALDTWRSDKNIASNRELVAQQLGPLAFDTAVAAVVGNQSSHLAERLHGTTPREIARSFGTHINGLADGLADGLAESLQIKNPLEPAYAGAGLGRPARPIMPHEPLLTPARPVELNEPLMMQAQNKGGGGGDLLRYRSYVNSAGETVHTFENARISGRKGNSWEHADGRQGFFAYDGKVAVTFPDGTHSFVDIGVPITHVQTVRRTNGNIEYSFNGRSDWDMLVSWQDRAVVARLRNGDIEIHLNTNPAQPALLQHTDHSVTTVHPNGLVVVQRPGYAPVQQSLGMRVARICSTEHADQSATVFLVSPEGRTQGIRLNRLQSVQQQIQQPLRPPPRPQQQLPPPVPPAGRTGADVGEPAGGGGRRRATPCRPIEPSQTTDPLFVLRPDIPRSPQRAIAHALLGIDPRLMPDNDLSSPADMHLATMDIANVLKEHFGKLGKH